MTTGFGRDDFIRVFLGFFFATAILFPFAAVIAVMPKMTLTLSGDVGSVFLLTAFQAALSAGVSVALGIVGGLGILSFERRLADRAGAIALLPNAAPVLVLLLAVMKLFPWARGLAGIIFVHVLLNAGLVSVAFAQSVRVKMAGFAELAWVEGSTGPRFFKRVALPILRNDLLMMFLFVFALCFTSFAVPLAIGGSRATTIEVLIYEKIRVGGDWSQAIGLAVLQTLALIAFTLMLGRGSRSERGSPRELATPLLKWRPGLLVPLAPCLVLLAGLFGGSIAGAKQVIALPALVGELPRLLAGSVLVGFGTGLAAIGALLLLAYLRPKGMFRHFLIGYAAPSSVLTGFAILIAWRELGLATHFKIVAGLTLIAIPSFYRFRWDALLASLDGQVMIAESLGAGAGLTFRRVVLPQVIRPAAFIGGLAALWAWGDFALSSVVAERSVTLAMAASALIESYRLDAATFLIWIVMLGGLATFGLFVGVGNVFGQEPQT